MTQETAQSLEHALTEIREGADAARTVSDWTRYLATEQAEAGGEMARAATALAAPQWGSVVREMFSDLYGSPVDADIPTDAARADSWVRQAVQRVAQTPEWAALRAQTAGDEWAAGMGTASLADAMADVLDDLAPKTDERAAQQAVDALQEMLADAQQAQADAEQALDQQAVEQAQAERQQLAGALADAQLDLAQAQADSAEAAAALQDLGMKGAGRRVRVAGARAAAVAAEEIQDTKQAMRAIGCGTQAGTLTRCASTPAAVRDALRRNPKLAEVAKLAGRLRAEARKRQESKANEAREEVCSVEMGADVARLLPSEIANLADEATEMLLLRKLSERGALQYQLRGKERQARGPLVLLLDESGSMAGLRDSWAKAAALALMDVAAIQKRAFAVVHFDGQVQRIDHFDPTKPVTIEQIEAMVGYFCGGGTNIGNAMRTGLDLIQLAARAGRTMGQADLVLLTDGEDPKDRRPILADMRAQGVGLYVIGLACRIGGDLREHAQDVVEITAADFTNPGAVGTVLGMA